MEVVRQVKLWGVYTFREGLNKYPRLNIDII
jgi:hypothetical protein